MAHPTTIGYKDFKTKTAANRYFQTMLRSYRDGETIGEHDSLMLHALIKRHPEAERKIGVGIKKFFKQKNPDYPSSGFWFERVDGSKADFNYNMCVSTNAKTPYAEFAHAARWSVRMDILRARNDAFEKYADTDGCVPCEVSGDRITVDNAHVDHAPPFTFEVILKSFLAAHNIQPNKSMIAESIDAKARTEFASNNLYHRFRQYHFTLARLRIVSDEINKRLAAESRVTNSERPVIIKPDYVFEY